MSLPVAYLPEAADDVDAGYAWYEHQLTGLGDQFLEAVRETVDRVSANPQGYGIFRHDIRAAPLRRFPYVVYYRDRGTDILVVAVQHGRRSARAWQGRA
jgi:plasmid stabilization system protein ParE